MYKLLVIALSIGTVLSASEDSLFSSMQVDLPADENSEVHELASSFNGLHTVCLPPTPKKKCLRNKPLLVSTEVCKKLTFIADEQAPKNSRRDERRRRRKMFVRDLNLQQTVDLPDNTHFLLPEYSTLFSVPVASSVHTPDENRYSSSISLSMPHIIGLQEFTNQSPTGLLKPVALKPSQVYDMQTSNQTSNQTSQQSEQ